MTCNGEIDQVEAKYSSACELMKGSTEAFKGERDKLVRMLERKEKIEGCIASQEEKSANVKAEWSALLRESEGAITTTIRGLRGDQRESDDLAEEYREMRSELEVEIERSTITAIDAARTMVADYKAAQISLLKVERRKVISQVMPYLVRYAAIVKRAEVGFTWNEQRFDLRDDPVAAALHEISSDAALAATQYELSQDEFESDVIAGPDISPLKWSDVESFIALQTRKRALPC